MQYIQVCPYIKKNTWKPAYFCIRIAIIFYLCRSFHLRSLLGVIRISTLSVLLLTYIFHFIYFDIYYKHGVNNISYLMIKCISNRVASERKVFHQVWQYFPVQRYRKVLSYLFTYYLYHTNFCR